MEEFLEEYNEELRDREDEIIAAIVAALSLSFNRLLQRIYDQSQSGQFLNLSIEAEIRNLIEPLIPDQSDDYLELFEDLLRDSTAQGLDSAAKLVEPVVDSPVSVSIQAAAVAAAAIRARGYLERHGRTLASEVAGSISQGLVTPTSVAEMKRAFNSRLNVVKSRAAVIVRTESFRSFNEASRAYFSQNGIKLVIYYATVDDRTCPYCAAQAGRVFKVNAIRVPRHPNCRCILVPYLSNEFGRNREYDAFRRSHRNAVHRYARSRGIELDDGPAYFEQSQPLPVRKDATN